jgi:hypothetical protein
MPLSVSAAAGVVSALEAALLDEPDDLVTHTALADVLFQHGDPRGRFMLDQIALEKGNQSPEQARRLQLRVGKLLRTHGREWFGELAAFLLDEKGKPAADFRLARGWLHGLRVKRLEPELATALARSPVASLLHSLAFARAPRSALEALRDASFLPRLRGLEIGRPEDGGWGDAVVDLLARTPRLEELQIEAPGVDARRLLALPSLASLRVLQIEALDEYPLAVLAANPACRRLLRLHVQPRVPPEVRRADLDALARSPYLLGLAHFRLWDARSLGDAACATLAASDLPGRLRVLDLQRCAISDRGARLLAACAGLRRLELLDLSGNQLTETGLTVLRSAGVHLRAERQIGPGHHDWQEPAPEAESEAGS